MNEQIAQKPVSAWRKVSAAILDTFTIFFGGGMAIASVTGGLTSGGFKLEGLPAFVLFGVIAAYFIAGPKFFGGTLWQHVLGTRRANRPA